MTGITSLLVSSPVTALEVEKTYILSGEASYLHAYDLETGEHLGQICLLGHRTIHGICRGEDGIYAVFGQKAVAAIHIEVGEKIRFNVLCEAAEFPDWVLDVAFVSHHESPSCLGLVLAHNSVMLWDWKTNTRLRHAHCAENCILYSARLLGNTWDGLTVAAGTVFNQVVLWSPTGPQDALGRLQVQRRLSGHQGVIFNLSHHEGRRLLCSVSDDRSIRLWHLDLENPPREQVGAAKMVLYGHSARVWDAKILDRTIVSVGEDATCCVWNESGDIIHRFTGHKGRSIWSLAVHANQKLIVTGGGDNSIRTWSLGTKQEGGITTEELPAITRGILPRDSSLPTAGPEMRTDTDGLTPRQLAVLNSGKIIVMTLNGYLLCYLLGSKQWSFLSHEPQFHSYSLLSVCPSHKMAALGNIRGRVKILSLDSGQTLVEMAVFTGKVFSLCWVNDDNLFVSGPDGLVTWWQLVASPAGYGLKELAQLRLPEAPQRWATAVALVPHQEGVLVCGDRSGSVLLYADMHNLLEEGGPSVPAHSLLCAHGKGGVTQVCIHAGYVYSAGRDGTYRQYRLQGTRLHLMNTYKVYKGFHWIEGLSFSAAGDVLVSGFHASSFIVRSQGSNETLVQIRCGGGHRAWGFAICQGLLPPAPGEETAEGSGRATTAVFACIKAQRILVCTAPGERLQQHPILKDSLHGRQISCITYVATVTLPEGECAVLATGSEDNAVNISAVILRGSQPATSHVLHRLNVHISSVRCLATCPSSAPKESGQEEPGGEVVGVAGTSQRFLLFSVGGRRAIQCWRVMLPGHCPLRDKMHARQWLKSSCIVEHLASYGNTDNVKQRRWLKKHGRPVDPETRFMSISVCRGGDLVDGKPSDCILGIVGSDACIRIFAFDERTNGLYPLLSSNWAGCCLLTTLSLVHDCPWGPTPILLTAGTDGGIALWDIRKAAHESGQDGTRDGPKKSSLGEEVENQVGEREGQLDIDVDMGAVTAEPCRNIARVAANDVPVSEEPGTRTSRNCSDTGRTIQPPQQVQELNQPTLVASNVSASSATSLSQEEAGHPEEAVPSRDIDHGIGQLLLSVKVHQSGVNALCASQLHDDQYLLASGGDDNAVQLSVLSVSCVEAGRQITVNLVGTHSIVSAHAAQVSGLCFIGACSLASTSIDQRLNVWHVQLPSDEAGVAQVEQVASKFITVADCAAMTNWTSRCGGQLIAVCGQGLQVLHLKEDLGTSLGTRTLST